MNLSLGSIMIKTWKILFHLHFYLLNLYTGYFYQQRITLKEILGITSFHLKTASNDKYVSLYLQYVSLKIQV